MCRDICTYANYQANPLIQPQLKATHEGTLHLGDMTLKVAVLDNGQRIITQTALHKAFGRPLRGSRQGGDQDGVKLPALIDARNLKPFISSELMEVIKPVSYESISGADVQGLDYTVLPLVCEVYLDAY